MRTEMIDAYLRQLVSSFGNVRAPVDDNELLRFFNAKDYTRMVGFVKKSMRVECRLRLGLVNAGGLSAPAWVETPDPMPRAGTPAFRNTLVTMFIRRDFIAYATFEALVYSMSHECAHIVLNSVAHPLRDEEVAVDLTCMLLGYRDYYVTGCQVHEQEEPSGILSHTNKLFSELFGLGTSYETPTTHRLGYLSREEVHYAARRMTAGF
jgi:hypothetical protein